MITWELGPNESYIMMSHGKPTDHWIDRWCGWHIGNRAVGQFYNLHDAIVISKFYFEKTTALPAI